MSNTVHILGIDPSLRNTGYCIVAYDIDNNRFSVKFSGTLRTDASTCKGLDAVKEMMNKVVELKEDILSQYVIENIIVEMPQVLFNASFATSGLLPVAAISGACTAILGVEKTLLVTPSEWNKRKKKDVTMRQTEKILGPVESWPMPKRTPKSAYEHIADAAGMALWFINVSYLGAECPD